MNRLYSEQRAKVISCLIEGCSIRSTVRMTAIAKKTVMRLVVEVGTFCAEYHDRVCSAISTANGCRLMNAGASYLPRTRTLRKKSPPTIQAAVMRRFGPQLTPKPNWYLAGLSASTTLIAPAISLQTLPAVLRIAFSLRAMV